MANRSGRTAKEELKKQLVDQPLHALWGLATGALPGVAGWGLAYVGPSVAAGSVTGWVLREREQLKDGSHTWWDPWLDSGVFAAAVIVGVLGSLFLALGTTS
jgi:hypothetical protein